MANLWQYTTYGNVSDVLTALDTWLVNTMGYTRNCAPTADTTTYTGAKAHYQYTFQTGETIYLNFHTDTVNAKLYLTTSTAYSSSLGWNTQAGTAKVLSGGVIYGFVVLPAATVTTPATSNNALYLFGDSKGNCQLFVQRGATLDIHDFMHWGLMDKSGFGTWAGGQYFGGWTMQRTDGTKFAPTLDCASGTDENPCGAIYMTNDSITNWAAIKTFIQPDQYHVGEPSSTIGTTSSTWSSIIVGSNTTSNSLGNWKCADKDSSLYNSFPSRVDITSEYFISGHVNAITGKIVPTAGPLYWVRHEATQRLSLIGRIPFGYQLPVSSIYKSIAPGTVFMYNGKKLVSMGNIAAEQVAV